MRYNDKEIEIISRKKVFGKTIVQIRILSSGEILNVPESGIQESDAEVPASQIAFHAMAARIRNEIATQKVLAPFESSIIPLPHQILALEKVMSGQFIRFLLADEVGMGKTIEAGLVMKELKLRNIVKRVLIIVTKTAMLQWKQELKQHFNETFHVYDTDYINTLSRTFSVMEADNEINFWSQHNQVIVSMDSLKPIEKRHGWSLQKVENHNRFRLESVIDAEFDLLIIDECHKVGGGDETVSRFKMADILCNAIPNVLLLSATPHRGKSDHFRRILQLLDADAFAGEGMPSIPDLDPVVVRTEKRHAIDYNGKPLFNKRRTEKHSVVWDDIQHRKQQLLYEQVTDYVIYGFNLAQQTRNMSYGFVMLLFQRMISSSTQAILDSMEKRAAKLAEEQSKINIDQATALFADKKPGISGRVGNLSDLLQMEPSAFDVDEQILSIIAEAHANYGAELETLKTLTKLARECLNTETDAKVEFLLEKLTELKRLENDPDIKFLVFTEFTATQRMLKTVLEEKGGYLCQVINGSMEFEARIEALKQFKEASQILISTDAAGESLNMQFAHVVINYDMPWNPMVVEQRIGRVDRIGQQHEVLAINLMLDNSVDRRVYEVIEIKLNQIMDELGIDKTADVLDSTMERESINRLYLTSLLSPEAFEKESASWLEDIKQKLTEYQTTEGVLPVLDSARITADKTDKIKYSPLPKWLETMTESYMDMHHLPFQRVIGGIRFTFPGYQDQIYTFDVRESLNNPIPEPLSLQHDIIKTILSQAVPYLASQPIPAIRFTAMKSVDGYWSLWQLTVKNRFETQEITVPLFCSADGDIFAMYASDIWQKLSQERKSLTVVSAMLPPETETVLQQMSAAAEDVLSGRYQEMETDIVSRTEKIRLNKGNAFDFRNRQLNRIGIENIRLSRQNRLEREKAAWRDEFSANCQILPDLRCLMLVKVMP